MFSAIKKFCHFTARTARTEYVTQLYEHLLRFKSVLMKKLLTNNVRRSHNTAAAASHCKAKFIGVTVQCR